MDTDNQPALSVLNLTQTAFDEILLLYKTFSRNPFDGLSLLSDYPPTTQALKAEYDRLERLKENPYEGPPTIIFLGIYRLPDKVALSPSNQVRTWLYVNRIESILQKYRTAFRDELSRTANDVRTTLLNEYSKSLKKLSLLLIEFKGKTADSFPKLANDSTKDWPVIFKELNDFIFLVRDTIEMYQYEINIWVNDKWTTSIPSTVAEPKIPAINILHDACHDLINDLIRYIDPTLHASLRSLINERKEPEQPIICQCKQSEIGRIFYSRVSAKEKKDRQIQTDKTIIAKWICRHFVRSESGLIKKLSESTILNCLSNKGLAKS